MGKVIRIKEDHILEMVKKIIKEQTEPEPGFTSIQDAIHYIEELLNTKILPEKQTEILNQYTIRVKQNQDKTFSVIIKGNLDGKSVEGEFPLQQVNNYVYSGNLEGKFKIGQISTEGIVAELKKDPKVKYFFEKLPKFERELLDANINAILKSDSQNIGLFKLSFFNIKRGKLKGAVSAGQEYPLGDFFNTNTMSMVINDNVGAYLESGYITLSLSKFYFSGPGVETIASTTGGTVSTGRTTSDTRITLSFALVDAFKFDETNFVDEPKAMEQIDTFVNKVKDGIQSYGQSLSQHIMSADPSIVGYASIDADPNEKITGKFGPCKSKTTRGEYNKCLSEYRAKKISEIINQKLEGTGVSLKFFGAGETTKFGPGWTKEKPTTTSQTAPNRRFALTPIPPFEKIIKKK